MSNNIEDALKIWDAATKKDKQEQQRQEEAELRRKIGATVQMAKLDKQYQKSLKAKEKLQLARRKSIGRSHKTSHKSTQKPSVQVVTTVLKQVVAIALIACLVATPIIASNEFNKPQEQIIMFDGLKIPQLQINTMCKRIRQELIDNNYGKPIDGLSSNIELTIEPNELINNLGLTSRSHMRLYILSTVIQDSDFENILKELGYRNQNAYFKDLDFEHNDDYRAGEQYSIEYDQKLRDLLKEINKNPELAAIYLERYPELRLIYDPQNTYLVNGSVYTTQEYGRSH